MPQEALVSVEHLYHFRCWHCSGWWSIADFQWPSPGASIHCPHCGKLNDLPDQPLTGKDFKRESSQCS